METPDDGGRWRFFRDVLILQVKLMLGNLQNFVMVPVTIVAALIDLFSKPGERHGERFYKVLAQARELDQNINLYGAIGGYCSTTTATVPPSSPDGSGPDPGTAVDDVIRRVEAVIVGEYRKGGTAASVKAAVDRVLDDLQRRSKR